MCPSLLDHFAPRISRAISEVQVSIVQQNKFEHTETVLERAELGIGYLRGGPKRKARKQGVGSLPQRYSAS